MRLIKNMMVCSIALIGLTVTSCKKEKYTSRDTSHVVPLPEEPGEPVDPTLVVFDNVDAKDGWQTVGDPVIETSGAKVGSGYLKNTIKSGDDFMQFIKHLATPLDSKLTTANGQFSFWWYISDVSAIKEDGQIEITSGGDADKDEYGWSVAKLLPTLKNGWNQVNLNLRDADLSGTPNPAALNFFRVFFWTKTKDHSDVITGVDGLVLRAVPPAPAVSFDNADKPDGWETVGAPTIETSGKKEGTGYLKNTIANGGDFMQFIRKFETPVNSTFNKDNGQFKFWWYISDVSNIKKDGSIELTSSGKADDHESAWDVAPLVDNLKNGWNEITLDFDKAINTGDGGADFKSINYFRVFFFTNSKDHPDVAVGIDDLRFTGK
ncbi:hypothetical protein [Pedobacter foliorum]|uniref:hypothetical protein n=1 Tax=Pedobacter foliorum TaxID=2739058 RepID=UPI0015677E51|nr:hypothetical protein [Pedobacter foliorum]NRF41553.1 hypothetical protein [Pedobacter foliorum]